MRTLVPSPLSTPRGSAPVRGSASSQPAVEVVAEPRRGVPVAVLARSGELVNSTVNTGDGPTGPVLGPGGADIDPEWVSALGLTGRAGETRIAPAAGAGPRWVVGVGEGKPRQWRTAGAALVRSFDERAAADADAGRRVPRSLQLELPRGTGPDEVAELVLGVSLGGYRFAVSNEAARPRLRSLRLIVRDQDALDGLSEVARRSVALAGATAITRDLANTVSNVKNPEWLAGTAARLADGIHGLRVTVRDERWLAEQGFGGMLAVGGGSASPPRLIELGWHPPGVAGPHLVLVGKGITFDTGGLSIKPAEGMHLMRTDMAGGAAVIATLGTVAALRLPVRVTGLVPCAENHVSGSSYRPGDVVRHYGGRTTEVTNTDAEGRMVLADALAYGVRRLKPDLLVDVATLTGAMKIALGLRTGGVFASDDELARRIADAGEKVGESWWRMPLLAEHEDAVRSDIADVRQCPPGPGGITAALFLREFTGGLPWAHLDIAGPARAEKTYDEIVPGATGFAARTLVEFVAGYAEEAARPS